MYECYECVPNYYLRSGIKWHMFNYHKLQINDKISAPKKNRQAFAQKKSSGSREPRNNTAGRRPAKTTRSKKRKNSKKPPAARSLKTQDDICCICYDRAVSVAVNPCHHKFCKVCVDKLIEIKYDVCPLCREPIISCSYI